jgi:hypothetical protein
MLERRNWRRLRSSRSSIFLLNKTKGHSTINIVKWRQLYSAVRTSSGPIGLGSVDTCFVLTIHHENGEKQSGIDGYEQK